MHRAVQQAHRLKKTQRKSGHLSLFEKVILVNSIMLITEALAGVWVTSHNLETHHYLIDTGFIILATLVTLFANMLLLRASFRPLFALLATIRTVSAGETEARVDPHASTGEIQELGLAFNSMLDRLEAIQREQTRLIFQAQEDERRRIALELHDETGQNLTALLIHTELLNLRFHALPAAMLADAACPPLLEELQQLTRLTQSTLENVRVLAQQLRPSVLDDLGLIAAFRWLVEDSAERLHLNVVLHITPESQSIVIPESYETALFRIAQESLTNIARHAQVQQANINLNLTAEAAHVQISDDGIGYNTEQKATSSGLSGMHARATQLGGTLTVRSQAGQGTTVAASLPLPTTSLTTQHKVQQQQPDLAQARQPAQQN